MSLAEKVEDAYISVVGNRVTAAAAVTTLGLNYAAFELVSYFSDRNILLAATTVAADIVLSLFSISYLVDTHCGRRTLHYFRSSERRIKKNGKPLTPRVVERWMVNTTENQAAYGYCQQQGIYLAARKYNQLEAFYEAKRKVSRVKIPHF